MKLPKNMIHLLVLVVVMLLTIAPATAQESEPQPHSRFGIVEAYYRPDDARDLDLGWERIIFEWAQIQPNSPDDFNTDIVPDEWLQDARDNGRDVVGLLKNTPHWASGSDLLGWPPTGLDLPVDDPDNYWAAFVQQTVVYYSENWGIHDWIIYNEPDIRPGDLGWYEFDGEVEDYAKMLKVAYLAAHAVDPDVKIHLAGMAWWVDVAANRSMYIQRLMRVLAEDPDAYDYGFYFDVVTVHVYFGTLNVWNVIVQIKAILEHYGQQNKEIWVDETNALPSLDPQTPMLSYPYKVTLGQQADFIVQAAALALAAGVDYFGVYRLYDDHFTAGVTEPWGLVRADGSRRPAFDAYQNMIPLFNDTTRARRYYTDNSSIIILEQPERTVYVMWARSIHPVSFFVAGYDIAEHTVQMNVYGSNRELTPQVIPGAEGIWYRIDTPAALALAPENVTVEGSPAILIVEGPPRAFWVQVEGREWHF